MTATQCIQASRCGEDDLLKFKPSVRTGKKGDLSDFERGMVVGVRRTGLSISQTADLLGFSHTTISRFTENGPKKRKCSIKSSASPISCFYVDYHNIYVTPPGPHCHHSSERVSNPGFPAREAGALTRNAKGYSL